MSAWRPGGPSRVRRRGPLPAPPAVVRRPPHRRRVLPGSSPQLLPRPTAPQRDDPRLGACDPNRPTPSRSPTTVRAASVGSHGSDGCCRSPSCRSAARSSPPGSRRVRPRVPGADRPGCRTGSARRCPMRHSPVRSRSRCSSRGRRPAVAVAVAQRGAARHPGHHRRLRRARQPAAPLRRGPDDGGGQRLAPGTPEDGRRRHGDRRRGAPDRRRRAGTGVRPRTRQRLPRGRLGGGDACPSRSSSGSDSTEPPSVVGAEPRRSRDEHGTSGCGSPASSTTRSPTACPSSTCRRAWRSTSVPTCPTAPGSRSPTSGTPAATPWWSSARSSASCARGRPGRSGHRVGVGVGGCRARAEPRAGSRPPARPRRTGTSGRGRPPRRGGRRPRGAGPHHRPHGLPHRPGIGDQRHEARARPPRRHRGPDRSGGRRTRRRGHRRTRPRHRRTVRRPVARPVRQRDHRHARACERRRGHPRRGTDGVRLADRGTVARHRRPGHPATTDAAARR